MNIVKLSSIELGKAIRLRNKARRYPCGTPEHQKAMKRYHKYIGKLAEIHECFRNEIYQLVLNAQN